MANYKRLIAELHGDAPPPSDAAIGRALGISTVYAWQLNNGKRASIDSKSARKMERAMGKEEGWMDTDLLAWPFPMVDIARYQTLGPEDKGYVQGKLEQAIEMCEQRAGQRTSLSAEERRLVAESFLPGKRAKAPGKKAA